MYTNAELNMKMCRLFYASLLPAASDVPQAASLDREAAQTAQRRSHASSQSINRGKPQHLRKSVHWSAC